MSIPEINETQAKMIARFCTISVWIMWAVLLQLIVGIINAISGCH